MRGCADCPCRLVDDKRVEHKPIVGRRQAICMEEDSEAGARILTILLAVIRAWWS
jgi:ferredoxin-thioredoxin reductase catalytic subunit